MDTPKVQLPGPGTPVAQNGANSNSNEVEMTESHDAESTNQIEETQAEDNTMPDVQAETEPEAPAPVQKTAGFNFLNFLTSPIVEIAIGEDDNQTILTAHQTLLIESPLLSRFVDKFEASGPRRIALPAENAEAFGCFLQFQYTHDYTETKPSTPAGSSEVATATTDNTGEELLRHARVYTLAEKLGMPALKSLAHKKIHSVNSTPSGELAYARYVYTNTSDHDTMIRKPIASYWAARSHTLRHGIEEEWKKICLDIPEFSFDVLTIVLNKKEKASANAEAEGTPRGRVAKRMRSEK
ncbi:hypothetical protein N7533_007889 [Penicillium manginii]|uniref:uncharacterized protein n=1 Tax=Penicillium manginii TaxID=203109 RepID=UPI002546DF9F|nr:uncharacterized protein N7533_007889 [Penicillium manginii]KAJ5750861.1 hypothetical protein N7533_007889 [Penicillium manginii]